MQGISIGTGSTIRATGPATGRHESWGVSYQLQGPHSTDFQLETHNGGISVDWVSGAITARAVNGGLSLAHIGGPINARTTNGGVSVSLDNSDTGNSPVFVETTNGGVSLTVPEDFNGELNVSTTNGRLRSDVGTPKRTEKYGNR